MKRKIAYVIILFIFTFLVFYKTKNYDAKNVLSKTEIHFDTPITITICNTKKAYLNKCFEICNEYENKFSNTIETSEISLINENSKKGIYTTVSDETLELLKASIDYGKLSDGTFDVTIGRLSSLWDITGDNPSVPASTDIAIALSTVDYNNIEIDGNKVILKNPDSQLDLGGIAKGYLADELKDYLVGKGVKSGILNLGGNVILIGKKPDNSNYSIGIQYPFTSSEKTIAILNISNKTIVTSGIYQRYFYENDIIYHHILDTKTGYPLNNDLLSVTIITDSSTSADALSTISYIKGLDAGLEFINNTENVEAVFVDKDYKIHLTKGLLQKENIIYSKN